MGSSASPDAAASASSIPSPTQSSSIVSPSISNPTSPSVISQISVESATQVTTIVGNLNPVGRGMVTRMRSLEMGSATVKEVIIPVAKEKPKCHTKSEEVYPKPILTHQENAPIIKKGEMGNR